MVQTRSDVRQQLSMLIESDYDYKRAERGDVCEAVVLSVSSDELIVDLGVKRDGIVPRDDLRLVDESVRAGLEVGDCVPVEIRDTGLGSDGIIVSLSGGLAQKDWLRVEEARDKQLNLEAEVTDVNKGGVLVSLGLVRGFVPNSHLSSIPPGMQAERLQHAKTELVGRVLTFAVLEVEQRRKRLILSERDANRRQRRELLGELREDEERTGVVRNLVDYGAFVDLGGVDGLVHISELDWRHLDHPSDVLDVGQEIEVQVLSVDRDRERIELSRKRLLPDPWDDVVAGLEVDQIVDGRVTNVVDFGAFVDVGRGVEGLVHTSEMPQGETARGELGPDRSVKVRVVNIDSARRRLALSLRGIPDAASLHRAPTLDESPM